MKVTLALLFVGLIVLAVADPEVNENSLDDEDDQDAALDVKEDVEVERRRPFLLHHTFRLCEHKSGTLGCPRGKSLFIHYANYGRTTGSHVCPHSSILTTNCRSSRSKIQIRKKCHGRSSCRLYASNSVYGDPCVGTFKYIEVRYSCRRRICYWRP